MKNIFIALCLLASLCTSAQVGDPTYHIIYLDNSRTSTEDGLNDMIFSKVLEVFDSIKNNPGDKFLFYVSNGKNFVTTENQKSVEKMVEQAFLSNPQILPDQQYDFIKLVNSFPNSLGDFKGKIKIHAFISENLAYRTADAYSPLFSLLPKQLASLTGQKNIALNLFYPKLTGRVKNSALMQSLAFYNKDEFLNSIVYNINGL